MSIKTSGKLIRVDKNRLILIQKKSDFIDDYFFESVIAVLIVLMILGYKFIEFPQPEILTDHQKAHRSMYTNNVNRTLVNIHNHENDSRFYPHTHSH